MSMTEYKGYQVKPATGMPTSYIIVTAGKGGSIPECLEGLFTSRTFAYGLIDKYLDSLPKEQENAQTVKKSRG